MGRIYQLIDYGGLGLLFLLTIVLTTSSFIATDGIQVELPKTGLSFQVVMSQVRTVTTDKSGILWLEKSCWLGFGRREVLVLAW